VIGDRADAARSAIRGFAADFGAVASWSAGRRELRAIEQPVLVLTGTRSPTIAGEVACAVTGLLPDAELLQLDAGHFAQIEAAADVAAAIRRIASA
jgi:pimeloyl-ACP methyl ester carboxylesterase